MTDYTSNIRDTCKNTLYLVRDAMSATRDFIGFTIDYIYETNFLLPLDFEDDE
jgi:hypothetical protein